VGSSGSNEEWMRPALTWLFDRAEPDRLTQALRDPETLASLRADVEAAIPSELAELVPAGDRGDNLLMGLIALRLKFPRDEATSKLETNLRLRKTG